MKIFIPSKGRLNHQTTYTAMERAGLKPMLVVNRDELAAHKKQYRCVDGPAGIAQTRQRILDLSGGNSFAMVDDDIVFSKVDKVTRKITTCTARELRRLFEEVGPLMLEQFAHGGVSRRQFVFAKRYPYVTGTGWYFRCAFMNPSLFKRPLSYRPVFGLITGEDVYSMLALARQGLTWFMRTDYCMQEKTAPSGSHFSESDKTREYKLLLERYGLREHLMTVTKQRRKTIRWSSVLQTAMEANDASE